jgi:hypothetical protein
MSKRTKQLPPQPENLGPIARYAFLILLWQRAVLQRHPDPQASFLNKKRGGTPYRGGQVNHFNMGR